MKCHVPFMASSCIKIKLIFTVLLVILESGVFCYKDTCEYTSRDYFKCGDFCVKDWHDGITNMCNCGNERFRSNSKYCCAPASACVRTDTGANCTQGEDIFAQDQTKLNFVTHL